MAETTTETAPNPTEAAASSEAVATTLLSSTEPAITTTQQGEAQQTQLNADGSKPAEAIKPETKLEGAPETYEFKAPEGKQYDSAVLDTFSVAAKEANLSQDAASKLIDKMAPALAARQAEQVTAIQNGWAEASRNDKEFGGEKLQENLSTAKKALEMFAPKNADGSQSAMAKMLDDTGLGNNPDVIRFLVRVGKGLSEDTFVGGSAKPEASRDIGKILYDKT